MGISKLSETFANRTHQQLNPQIIRSANDYSELYCTSFHWSHLGFCKCSYCIYFSFSQSFVLACVKCSFSGKSSILYFQTLKCFFYLCGNKTSWVELLTALYFVLHLRLNAPQKGLRLVVHSLALISRGYVFRMFTLLLCTCAYLLSLQMALTLQNAQQNKRKTPLWRGLTWMETYPLPLGCSRRKRHNLLWSVSDWRTSHVIGADWQIKAGVMELRLCLLALRLVNIKAFRVWVKLKERLHEKGTRS